VSDRGDPFATLGLPARSDLTDEDVRAAWRRIAAATHPDRPDGGDPARYSAAAAAYDTLRTSFGRGEALADLGLAGYAPASRATRRGAYRGGSRAKRARLPRASKRTMLGLGAVAAATIAVAAVGWTPASIALLVGAATCLIALYTRRP
jgi:curved DNA-binding protein CbpA